MHPLRVRFSLVRTKREENINYYGFTRRVSNVAVGICAAAVERGSPAEGFRLRETADTLRPHHYERKLNRYRFGLRSFFIPKNSA